MRLAVTGATGFVGGHLLDAAATSGHSVAALARRPQPPRSGVEWIAGSLDDRAALEKLVAGADAVIHVAGVVNAPDAAGFEAGNVIGTGAVLAAAEEAGTAFAKLHAQLDTNSDGFVTADESRAALRRQQEKGGS